MSKQQDVHVFPVPGYGGARVVGPDGVSWHVMPPEGIWRVLMCRPGDEAPITIGELTSYEQAVDLAEQHRRRGWRMWQMHPKSLPTECAMALRRLALKLWAARTHPDINAGPFEHDVVRELAEIGRALRSQGFELDEETAAALEAEAEHVAEGLRDEDLAL